MINGIMLVQLNARVGDVTGNCAKIIKAIGEAKRAKASLVLFPEMALAGYPPEDLLHFDDFIDAMEQALMQIVAASQGIAVCVGLARRASPLSERPLYNSMAVIENGRLIGFQDKILLPTYDLFDESRYFASGGKIEIWNIAQRRLGLLICEDIWQHAGLLKGVRYSRDPVEELGEIDALLVPSASPYQRGKGELRMAICRKAVETLRVPLYLCNQVGGNDGILFDGGSFVMNPQGEVEAMAPLFEEVLFYPTTNSIALSEEEELYRALVLGIRDYFGKLGWKRALLGLSGGIDSAVVAALGVAALGAENVEVLFLPSHYSSIEAREDAVELARRLGVGGEELSIEAPLNSLLELLHIGEPGPTEQNLQARIRGILLMARSNEKGALLLNTGNKSELAMGYTTLYGDLCGALAVLGDVTKGRVYRLAHFINREREVIPKGILERIPTAELAYNQRDTDTLPDYEVVDALVEEYVEEESSVAEIVKKRGWDEAFVRRWLLAIDRSEFKRRQAPPCLRVTKKSFNCGRRMPIVNGRAD